MSEKSNIRNWFKSYFTNIVIETISTPVNPSLQVCLSEGKYTLHSAADNYSCTSLARAFFKLLSKINIRERKIGSVLILGVGTGSLIDILRNDYKLVSPVIGVEKDEEVIRLARQYFKIDDHKDFTLVADDAFHFLENHNNAYDLVISEVFTGLRVPDKYESTTYLEQLKKVLAPGGLIIYSEIIADKDAKKSVKTLIDNFEKVFGAAKVNKIWEFWKTWFITYDDRTAQQETTTNLPT